jgi:hypothetical protein
VPPHAADADEPDGLVAHAVPSTTSTVMYGRPPLGKDFLTFLADASGAVMYAAFRCGR